MQEGVCQGDILKIEKIEKYILVVSKNYFNQSGEIIGCPIFREGESGPLHISISFADMNGYVHCEKLKLFDLTVRGYKKIGRIPWKDLIDITDAIQSIFDYV